MGDEFDLTDFGEHDRTLSDGARGECSPSPRKMPGLRRPWVEAVNSGELGGGRAPPWSERRKVWAAIVPRPESWALRTILLLVGRCAAGPPLAKVHRNADPAHAARKRALSWQSLGPKRFYLTLLLTYYP